MCPGAACVQEGFPIQCRLLMFLSFFQLAQKLKIKRKLQKVGGKMESMLGLFWSKVF